MTTVSAEGKPALEMHPLVRSVVDALVRGKDEPMTVPAAAIERLVVGAKQLSAGEQVFAAVRDAVRLCAVLEKGEKSPKAAAELLKGIQPVIAYLEALAKADGKKASQKVDGLRKSFHAQKKALSKGPGVAGGFQPGGGKGVGIRKR
jgi:hypothetical protein